MVLVFDAASALSETALKLRPGGSIRPFCEPDTVTSTPQRRARRRPSQRRNVSTMSSAGCFARSIALRTSAMRLVAPVEVSLCTTITALMVCACRRRALPRSAAGSAPRRQSPGMKSTSSLALRPASPQGGEVAGLGHQHLVAGRQRVDDRRLPRAGARRRIDDHRFCGLEDGLMPSSTCRPSSANSGPRWSMVGMSIARSTRSGTGVGPGICRKCRPGAWPWRAPSLASQICG